MVHQIETEPVSENLITYLIQSEITSISRGEGKSLITTDPPMTVLDLLRRGIDRPFDSFLIESLPSDITTAEMEYLRGEVGREQSNPLINYRFLLGLLKSDTSDLAQVVNLLNHTAQYIANYPDQDAVALILNPEGTEIKQSWKAFCRNMSDRLIPLETVSDQHLLQSLPISKNWLGMVLGASTSAKMARELLKNVSMSDMNTGTSIRQRSLEQSQQFIFENEYLNQVIGEHKIIGMRYGETYGIVVSFDQNRQIRDGRNNCAVIGSSGVSGKGTSKDAAVCSGMFELAERIQATHGATPDWPNDYIVTKKLERATFTDMQKSGQEVLNPNDYFMARPYNNQPLVWMNARRFSLPDPTPIWVPAQIAFYETNFDELEFIEESSNGLASGNTFEEATLHALFEIMERDGIWTIPVTRSRLFRLDPDVLPDSDPKTIITSFIDQGLSPMVFNATSDYGVPVYKAFVRTTGGLVVSGSGAHLNGTIALTRALCELGAKCAAIKSAHLEENLKTTFDTNILTLQSSDIPNYSSGSVQRDLNMMYYILMMNSLPPIVVDLTTKSVNVPTVRVIIPELDKPYAISPRVAMRYVYEISNMK
jgi:YcaO-like protein with predicted kinase domain